MLNSKVKLFVSQLLINETPNRQYYRYTRCPGPDTCKWSCQWQSDINSSKNKLCIIQTNVNICLIFSVVKAPMKILKYTSLLSHNTKQREHASQENGKKVMQFFPTAVCNVTAWRHSRLRAHWLMAQVGGGGGGGLREKYVFCVLRELQRLLSVFCLWEESVGGA